MARRPRPRRESGWPRSKRCGSCWSRQAGRGKSRGQAVADSVQQADQKLKDLITAAQKATDEQTARPANARHGQARRRAGRRSGEEGDRSDSRLRSDRQDRRRSRQSSATPSWRQATTAAKESEKPIAGRRVLARRRDAGTVGDDQLDSHLGRRDRRRHRGLWRRGSASIVAFTADGQATTAAADNRAGLGLSPREWKLERTIGIAGRCGRASSIA